jgi:hypothetical protein
MPLFKSKLGLFGYHKKSFVNVWVHLVQCFFKIDKPMVTLKCLARAMTEIGSLLGGNSGDLLSDHAEPNDEDRSKYLSEINGCVAELVKADRFTDLEGADP